SRTIRLPINVNEKLSKLHKQQRQLAQTLKRPATIAELAAAMSLEPEQIRDLLQQNRQPLSLDLRIGDSESSNLGDLLEDDNITPQEYAAQTSLKEDLWGLVSNLTQQQQRVIALRYGLHSGSHMSLAQIGKQMDISRERVRQIEREALKKMRRYQTGVREYLAAG
ncbi:MAG: sigma-70 family RNA polymerase sigma factor, partial [Cyanobacteria bacterium J06633_23]